MSKVMKPGLLLDSSQIQVTVPEEVLLPILSDFFRPLGTSRLQRLARVLSPLASRERAIEQALMGFTPQFDYKCFPHPAQALSWLEA
ncbi:hypothetical protein TH63_09385 [Rufibacter radiotolerans]|uniref:Uncharacterized protein n=1 Tax=Rufibacter radiotolerans TaxID=1379910 RepID=A0A0H4VPE0_9BACT|nr:hypothetical protein TH63_09385 [Rufibacter radiotolerans]